MESSKLFGRTIRENEIEKKIKEFKSIKDEKKQNLFYIVNYQEGDFIIISADKRISPILAYSDDSEFRTNADEYSSGLIEWLSTTKEGIQYVRKNNILQSEEIKNEWNNLSTSKLEPDPYDCEDQYEEVSPLLSTKWHQGCGFNDFMPNLNCFYLPCQRAYAGCVPIAIAQVMKYHSYPTNYNWAGMPNNYGTTTTASLIKDIHNSITVNISGNEYSAVSYDCDGTGVNKDYNIANVFTNKFGYSTAN